MGRIMAVLWVVLEAVFSLAFSRLPDRGEDAKEKAREKLAGRFLPFSSHLRAFSIQRARLSWNLEQAIFSLCKGLLRFGSPAKRPD